MQRVFADKNRALEALQDYANFKQEPCAVVVSRYGRERTCEYTIRPVDDIINPNNKDYVLATCQHVVRPAVARQLAQQQAL